MDLYIITLLLVTIGISQSTYIQSDILQASTRLSSLADDSKELSIHIEGHEDIKQKLKQVQIPRHKSHSRQTHETDGIFVSDDGTTCRENCIDGAECDTSCLQHFEGENCYISHGRAFCTQSSDDTDIDMLDTKDSPLRNRNKRANSLDDDEINDLQYVVASQGARISRKKRQTNIVQDFDRIGIIRLAFYVDKPLMDTFMSFTDNNVTKAKLEAENFLTLYINEISLILATLGKYGVTFVFNGFERRLDLSLYISKVFFPPDDGVEFSNFDWSANNTNGTLIFLFINANGERSGYPEDFSAFISENVSTEYDLAIAYSGYDYSLWRNGVISTSVAGSSALNSVCSLEKREQGANIVVVGWETTPFVFSRLLGNGLGAFRANEEDCTDRPYVMNSPPERPTTAYPDLTFSSCSAKAIKTYLENVDIPECLYFTGVNEANFLEKFCKGTLGYLENSVDRQCQLQQQWIGSTPCNLENEPEGYVHRCVYDPALRRAALYCLNRRQNLCYPKSEVNDGTPCTPRGTTFTDRVCYRGECVKAIELCPPQPQLQRQSCPQKGPRRPYRAREPTRPSSRQPSCSRGGY